MTYKSIFFDLDGTLTDSGEGIINSAILALEHFGLPIPSRQELGVFVGPPLDQTFRKFGVPPEKTAEAIAVFRSRYVTVGKFENFPYPGIPEVLQVLREQGFHLYVATSKPEVTALEVLEHFGMTHYFEKICGAAMDGSRVKKEDVIEYLLSQLSCAEDTVMVGDTAYDVLGAAVHGIPTIGAGWGYGKVQEMWDAGAVAIAESPRDLLRILEV